MKTKNSFNLKLKTYNSKFGGRRLPQEGQTMVDLMITAALIGVAMAVIAVLTFAGVRAWQNQLTRLKLERQAQSFMYVLTYNLRQAQTNSMAITNLAGEMNNSLLAFTPAGKSLPVSFYLRSVTSGGNVL